MKWEIRKASSEADVIREINLAAQPFGLVIFGADSNLKNTVTDLCIDKISRVAWANRGPLELNSTAATMLMRNQYNLVIALNGDESTSRDRRQLAAQILRDAGVDTVIGIYIKTEFIEASQLPTTDPRAFDAARTHNYQVEEFEACPPEPSEFDFICIVSED